MLSWPRLVALFLFAFLAAVPVLAHHSINAEFYPDKDWSQTGVLTKIEWINPHTVTWISVKDPQTGKTQDVACQGGNPRNYSRNHLTPADWRIGEVVTLTCLQARNGSRTWGFIKSLRYASDGHTLSLRRNFVG